jgi:hypothetical protein
MNPTDRSLYTFYLIGGSFATAVDEQLKLGFPEKKLFVSITFFVFIIITIT